MSRRYPRMVAAPVLALLATGAVAGCSALAGSAGHRQAGPSTSSGSPGPAAVCGTAHTAAGVPVTVDVEQGNTPCSAALTVEKDYVHALASGQVAGNGGGAPVTIHGWVCQGFNTPELLATGKVSACHRTGAEILVILASPSPSPS